MLYDGRPLRAPTSAVQKLIMHERGHAFGLWHTGRRTATMRRAANPTDTLSLFTGQEERAARAAYRAGRGSYYCGDPDRCGTGTAYPPDSLLVPMDDRTPRIVAD